MIKKILLLPVFVLVTTVSLLAHLVDGKDYYGQPITFALFRSEIADYWQA
jgi:hypothetical protein